MIQRRRRLLPLNSPSLRKLPTPTKSAIGLGKPEDDGPTESGFGKCGASENLDGFKEPGNENMESPVMEVKKTASSVKSKRPSVLSIRKFPKMASRFETEAKASPSPGKMDEDSTEFQMNLKEIVWLSDDDVSDSDFKQVNSTEKEAMPEPSTVKNFDLDRFTSTSRSFPEKRGWNSGAEFSDEEDLVEMLSPKSLKRTKMTPSKPKAAEGVRSSQKKAAKKNYWFWKNSRKGSSSSRGRGERRSSTNDAGNSRSIRNSSGTVVRKSLGSAGFSTIGNPRSVEKYVYD